MSKYLTVISLLLTSTLLEAQVLTFDHGEVEFHTSSIMSDIEAFSEEMDVQLDTTTGDFEIVIPIESFDFEYEMMQDHFNEDYLESEKYPNATFSGKIGQKIPSLEEAFTTDISGDMTIHGVTKAMSFPATFSEKEGLMRVRCTFPIVFKDFEVDEPSILTKAVAKDVEVKVSIYLK